MNDRKKIVLGSEDFLAKGVDDIYININLQQTFNEIKKDKYDNNFDLAEQFRKERNESRSFRIYGILDSNIIDTDNITLKIYKDKSLNNYIGSVTTTPLVYDEQNVFAKKRGKYLIPLDNYNSDSIFIEVVGDMVAYDTQVFEQKLVFYDLENNFVEYGTETVDVGFSNQGFLDINNNFPFFYNKHWIKKDIQIIETKPRKVQFNSKESIINEGDSISFVISLDSPSPFGNETVVLDTVLGSTQLGDFSLKISGNSINFPTTLTWNKGEQYKVFDFDALTDPVYEFSERMSFTLSNFNFVESGLTTEHFVTIQDTTPRNFTNYHFGEMYKNRLEFSGRTVLTGGQLVNTNAYSILRNGLKNERKNESFYPNDTFKIHITNKGIDTILPQNQNFGIGTEELWLSEETKIFNLDTQYDGNELHKIKLIFPQGVGNNMGQIRINGVRITDSTTSTPLTFNKIKPLIVDGSPTDYIVRRNYEKDWKAEIENQSTSAITITSKCVGLPVDVDIVPYYGQTANSPIDPNANPYIEEINPFVERKQIPKVIKLYANDINNSKTIYQFSIQKNGYSGAEIQATPHPATSSGVDRFLVSSFEKIARNWNGSQYMNSNGNDCIYDTNVMPISGQSSTTELSNGSPYLAPTTFAGDGNYFWPVGVAYINGSLFLTEAGGINYSKLNLTNYLSSEFKPSPLSILPCTNSNSPTKDIAQVVKLTIPKAFNNGPYLTLLQNNAELFRSFDFKTGTTGQYTTVYKDSLQDFNWKNNVNISGATNGISTLGTILDYGDTQNAIPFGPFLGLDLVDKHHLLLNEPDESFYLKSKTPGVPFEITNIKDAYILTSASNQYNQNVTAGDYTFGGPITVELITQNANSGVGVNISNNYMGGYNVDLILNNNNTPPITTTPIFTQPTM